MLLFLYVFCNASIPPGDDLVVCRGPAREGGSNGGHASCRRWPEPSRRGCSRLCRAMSETASGVGARVFGEGISGGFPAISLSLLLHSLSEYQTSCRTCSRSLNSRAQPLTRCVVARLFSRRPAPPPLDYSAPSHSLVPATHAGKHEQLRRLCLVFFPARRASARASQRQALPWLCFVRCQGPAQPVQDDPLGLVHHRAGRSCRDRCRAEGVQVVEERPSGLRSRLLSA